VCPPLYILDPKWNLETRKNYFAKKPFFTVEGLAMNKELSNILRIDVLCPKCQQINMQIAAKLMASLKFNCHFCKSPIDVSSNQEVKAALDDLKDFVEHSYVPN
jgi:hypothetical protein